MVCTGGGDNPGNDGTRSVRTTEHTNAQAARRRNALAPLMLANRNKIHHAAIIGPLPRWRTNLFPPLISHGF
jgi:hypothetical protein